MVKDIFLSSTFNDFHYERDLFQKTISPMISDKLSDSTINFIDLRWGIETLDSDEAMRKVLRICAEVIHQTKPLFILFLGDYYGSLPSAEDFDVVSKLYGIKIKERKSVTEFEAMVSGIFDNEKGLYLVINRTIVNKEEHIDSRYFEKDNVQLLSDFKDRISKTNAIFIEEYARIDKDGLIEIIDEEKFVDKIVNSIYDYLANDITLDTSSPSNLLYHLEHDLFESLEIKQNKIFNGRLKELKELQQLIDENQIVRISGTSGIGKTSLMTKLKSLYQNKGTCISYYCGDTLSNPSYYMIMNYLSVFFGIESNDMYSLIRKLPEQKFYYIFLDAVNECRENYLQNLNENLIPRNVKIILSGIDLKQADYVLQELETEDVVPIIEAKCKEHYKEPPSHLIEYLRNHNERLQMLRYPIQLQLFVNAIMNINEEEYNVIKEKMASNCSFMQTLSSIFIEKLERQKNDLFENFNDLLGSNNQLDLKLVLLITSLFLQGISVDRLTEIYKVITGKDFSVYDFFNFRSAMGNFYQKDLLGKYHITHSLVRQYIDESFSYDQIIEVSNSILNLITYKIDKSYEDYIEIFNQLIRFNRYEELSKLFAELYTNDALDETSLKNSCNIAFSNIKFDIYNIIVRNGEPFSIAFCLKYVIGYIDDNTFIALEKVNFEAYKVLRKYKEHPVLKETYQDIALSLFNHYTELTYQRKMVELFCDDQSLMEVVPINIIVMIANNPLLKIDAENYRLLKDNIKNDLLRGLMKNAYTYDELRDFFGNTLFSAKIMNSFPESFEEAAFQDSIKLNLMAILKLLDVNNLHINNKIRLAIQYCFFTLRREELVNERVYDFLAKNIEKYEAHNEKDYEVYYDLTLGYYLLSTHYRNDIAFNNFLHIFKLFTEDYSGYKYIIDLNLLSQLLPNLIIEFSLNDFDFNILRKLFRKYIEKYDYLGDYSIALNSTAYFLIALYLAMVSDYDSCYPAFLTKINSKVIESGIDSCLDILEQIKKLVLKYQFTNPNDADFISNLIRRQLELIKK